MEKEKRAGFRKKLGTGMEALGCVLVVFGVTYASSEFSTNNLSNQIVGNGKSGVSAEVAKEAIIDLKRQLATKIPIIESTPKPLEVVVGVTPTVETTPTKKALAEITLTSTVKRLDTLTPTTPPTVTVTLTPTPTPIPIEDLKEISIPAIELQSVIVESPIANNVWQVPKFVVGHLEGTALLGEEGNIALVGHVTSISSGNVFKDIGRLKVNDEIIIHGDNHTYVYKVRLLESVGREESNVTAKKEGKTLELITCTGDWIQSIREYDQRLIVEAVLESTS